MAAGDPPPVGQHQGGAGFDGGHRDAFQDRDPARRERRAQTRRQFGVFLAGDPPRLDQGHGAAEAGVRVRHFQPDRPAAQDQQMRGRLGQVEQGLVGQERHLVEAGDRRHRGAAAGGDDDAPCEDAPVFRRQGSLTARIVDRQGGGIEETGLAASTVGAEGAVASGGVGRGDRGDHAPHMRAHRVPVDRRRRQVDPEAAGAARRFGRMRRGQQRLGRHAAGVEAVAAHRPALDQRHLEAELGCDRRDRQPGGAGADHGKVVALGHRRAPARGPGDVHHEVQASRRRRRRQSTGARDSAASASSGRAPWARRAATDRAGRRPPAPRPPRRRSRRTRR